MNVLLDERKKRKLRQRDMSKVLGIGISTYSMYESKKLMVPRDIAFKISELFGIEVDEIFLPKTFMIHE